MMTLCIGITGRPAVLKVGADGLVEAPGKVAFVIFSVPKKKNKP